MARQTQNPTPPADRSVRDDWYRRWIADIADDIANNMEGEQEREERMNALHWRLAQLHRKLNQLPGGQRGRGPRAEPPATTSASEDARIQSDVKAQMTEDWYLDASNVTVSVANAEVTLTGTVESRIAKRLAEDCADSIPGVRDVINKLRIQPADPGAAPSRTAI